VKKYICIHGHFYQPPRENPWLEAIEFQDTAYPYHDWNERITAECYAPNATSRILDEKGLIKLMVNNYAKINFNFGPTLLTWMEKKASYVYGAILEADLHSQELYSGHGSAMAQAYSHMVLPLANARDKYTQILWGIYDFEYRFGRRPEGMWLPETAVDIETLDIMAEQGIRFTVLAPHQAKRVRSVGGGAWKNVTEKEIDTTMPYLVNLPSGRAIVIFFYNGIVSRAVAFEGLLRNGGGFAQRLLGSFSEAPSRPEIVHIATDGESYGHHHRFGDMALAYALHHIESTDVADLTNYGEYLDRYPPDHEAEIHENTSWSCMHGVERWRNNCGCRTGQHPDWNQSWRMPLRETLDWLRDNLGALYEKKMRLYLKDPWDSRNDYIRVVLDRSPESIERFMGQHAIHKLNKPQRVSTLKLLELQRHLMLMYTSCGWFFDEISGIETRQILQYAGRALQLGQELFDRDFEPEFLERLEGAKSNVPEYRDGRHIYEMTVSSDKADLKKVAAHYAICSLFSEYPKESSFYCYRAEQEKLEAWKSGKARLLIGKARFISQITNESEVLGFGSLHLGNHNLSCGVRQFDGKADFSATMKAVSGPFISADFPEAIRRLDECFMGSVYSLESLFRDEENRILGLILDSVFVDAENVYRQLYENHAPLMRFFKNSALPPPKTLHIAAEFVLNTSLREALEKDDIDSEVVESILEEAREEGIGLDTTTLEYAFRKNLERMAKALLGEPTQLSQLRKLDRAMDTATSIPFQVNLWMVQNVCYEILQSTYSEMRLKAGQGSKTAKDWISCFEVLCQKLSLAVTQSR
jgi:alpha-amylase/alpha-mannosidase (GH57 family)